MGGHREIQDLSKVWGLSVGFGTDSAITLSLAETSIDAPIGVGAKRRVTCRGFAPVPRDLGKASRGRDTPARRKKSIKYQVSVWTPRNPLRHIPGG